MSLLLFLGYLAISSVSALKLSFTRSHVIRSTAGEIGDASLDLNTVRDFIYMANVTIGGTDFPVQIDTGSSDLWITSSSDSPFSANVHETSTSLNLTYGIGWAYGSLSYADIVFSGNEISNQAFVHASDVQNPALSYGAQGILGLGFTTLSNIDVAELQQDTFSGRSLLYRLFETDTSVPNFIAFSLQRSTEEGDEVEGSFSIGEFDPEWAHVQDVPSIPTFPVSAPARWNVLIDAIIVGQDVTIPSTSIPGAPSDRAVGLLDTGTSYTYVPEKIAEAIYASAPGAKYDRTAGYWEVPCDVEIDAAIQIGGQVFPLHPLDVTPASLMDTNKCVGSFVPQSVSVADGEFDWLIGDNVLRSMYNVYDFGDYTDSGEMGNPYVKLLSLIDPDEASADFASSRGSTPRTGITYGSAEGTMADSSSTSVTLSVDVAKSINLLGKLFPVVLAIMGLNALVLLGLLIFGIVYFCRKQKRDRAPSRTNRGRLSPMPLNLRNSYGPGNLPQPSSGHGYQPVSMAITEDTFVPSTPTYHKFESSIQPGDRPRSMAVPMRAAKDSMDEPFVPPSPAFHKDGSTLRPGNSRGVVDRPNSVA